jgi:hypothetical protein
MKKNTVLISSLTIVIILLGTGLGILFSLTASTSASSANDLNLRTSNFLYVGNLVWEDLDMDGIQDAGEPGISGIIVNLLDESAVLVASALTDGSGHYFIMLSPAVGNYYLEFVLPGGYVFSPKDQGLNDALDSDADPTTGRTDLICVGTGIKDINYDAGMYTDAPPPPPPPPYEGHTPGYWKRHTDEWVDYVPTQILDDVFDFPPELAALASDTLMDALKYGGGKGIIGKAKNLLRAAVAAVISAAHPDINYSLLLADIISAVNAALASLDPVAMGDLAGDLDDYNNLGVS